MGRSPYSGATPQDWPAITAELIERFPLRSEELVAAVDVAWSELYASRIGSVGLLIGADIFIPAQATGVILERLIATHLARAHAGRWRSGTVKGEKDIVCTEVPEFSFEVKTSSHPRLSV